MLKKIIGVVAMLAVMTAFVAPTNSVDANAGDVRLIAETGEFTFIPTCAWSMPDGYYTKTAAYTYLGRLPVSEPSSKYPGNWECASVVRHMVRFNHTSLWSPLSSKYGTQPDYVRTRSKGTNPTAPESGEHYDQAYELRGAQILNHFYDDMTVAYFSTSYTNFTLHKFVNGTPVAVDPSLIEYSLNSTTRCLGGNDDRMNCKWIHRFKTTRLETSTYRVTFTDTNSVGQAASKNGSYQLFFYLTR